MPVENAILRSAVGLVATRIFDMAAEGDEIYDRPEHLWLEDLMYTGVLSSCFAINMMERAVGRARPMVRRNPQPQANLDRITQPILTGLHDWEDLTGRPFLPWNLLWMGTYSERLFYDTIQNGPDEWEDRWGHTFWDDDRRRQVEVCEEDAGVASRGDALEESGQGEDTGDQL